MRERMTSSSLRQHGAHTTNERPNQLATQRSTATAMISNGKRSATLLAFLLVLPSVAAQAQTEAPAVVPAPAADAPPPAAAMPPPPPPAAPPPAVEAATTPPTAAEAMPATRPETLPPIDVGAWTRVGGKFQRSTEPKSLKDWRMDSAYVELHAGGKIHKMVGVTLNLNADMQGYSTGALSANIEDAIISFDFMEEFHLWGGHLLVPVDRANSSGPFFMIPWNYPSVASPKEGPFGRSNGAVVWGNIAGGKFKYLFGAFDNGDSAGNGTTIPPVDTSPLYSGRVLISLLDAEPGFWGNASYFGDKDILSIGLGGQFQKHGSATMAEDKSWTEVNADILFEKKLPGGAFFTAEGAYYHFGVPDLSVSDAFYALVAFATSPIGIGNLQPMARIQYQKVKVPSGVTANNPWNLDIALAYLIKGPALRVIATYGHTKVNDMTSTNSIQLGAQAIFF